MTIEEMEKGFQVICKLFKRRKTKSARRMGKVERRKTKVVGAIGGIVIDEDSDKYTYRKGLFVIVESGDTVKILNDHKFKPKV